MPEGYVPVYLGNNVKDIGSYTVTAKIFDSEGNLVKELTATLNIVDKVNDDNNDEKNDVELPLV